MGTTITVDIDLDDNFSNLSTKDQKKFLIDHISDLSVSEIVHELDADSILDEIGYDDIIKYLSDRGFTVTED